MKATLIALFALLAAATALELTHAPRTTYIEALSDPETEEDYNNYPSYDLDQTENDDMIQYIQALSLLQAEGLKLENKDQILGLLNQISAKISEEGIRDAKDMNKTQDAFSAARLARGSSSDHDQAEINTIREAITEHTAKRKQETLISQELLNVTIEEHGEKAKARTAQSALEKDELKAESEEFAWKTERWQRTLETLNTVEELLKEFDAGAIAAKAEELIQSAQAQAAATPSTKTQAAATPPKL